MRRETSLAPFEIITAACVLGVKLTRAPVGSEAWELWASKIEEAQMYHKMNLQRDGKIDRDLMQSALDGRERAKREADALA